MKNFDVKKLLTRSRGNWFNILTSAGISPAFLTGKNGPCPQCGGKDRFRWDNKNGDGSGFCHQCNFKGNGLALLSKWSGLEGRHEFPKLLCKLNDLCSNGNVSANEHSVATKKQKDLTRIAHAIFEESKPLVINTESPACQYFRRRGLKVPLNVTSIRYHRSLTYFENGTAVGRFPAIVAKISDNKNNLIAIHRIYLDSEGNKASVREAKLALGKLKGGSIQLDDASGDSLNIAEGLETALAVRQITNQPTWSAISAGNLTRAEIPSHVKTVYIWADLDKSGTGEKAANELALRLHYQERRVYIKVPMQTLTENQKSIDWLDVLNTKEQYNV
ncbi:MAG: DUF7146 domain-containing protein [Bdellovibrio sp.]